MNLQGRPAYVIFWTKVYVARRTDEDGTIKSSHHAELHIVCRIERILLYKYKGGPVIRRRVVTKKNYFLLLVNEIRSQASANVGTNVIACFKNPDVVN